MYPVQLAAVYFAINKLGNLSVQINQYTGGGIHVRMNIASTYA